MGGTCTFKTYAGMESSGYWFCTDAKSWSGARAVCQSASETDLVHIDDSAENDFITANVVSDSWHGGNDISVEGTWRWSDDRRMTARWGEFIENYRKNEPNSVLPFKPQEVDTAWRAVEAQRLEAEMQALRVAFQARLAFVNDPPAPQQYDDDRDL